MYILKVLYKFNKTIGIVIEKLIACFYFCINDWKVKTLLNNKNEFLIQKVSKKNKKSAVLKNISKKQISALF